MRRYLAEFIGTFGLVFAGCRAIVINAHTGGQVTQVGIGLTFGLVVAAMIYATGHLSGAHLNPAVSLAFAVTRHFPLRYLLPYSVAQLAGAAAAGGTLRLLFGPIASLGATLPRGSAWQALVLEGILTFFLMSVIMAMATDSRAVGQSAPLRHRRDGGRGGPLRRPNFWRLDESRAVLRARPGKRGIRPSLGVLDSSNSWSAPRSDDLRILERV